MNKFNVFKYDSRLRNNELSFFEDLIGKNIVSLQLENASVRIPPEFGLENMGRCLITFNAPKISPFAKVELFSIFQETPVVDSGGISIRKIYESRIPTKTRIDFKIDYYWFQGTHVNYPDNSEITSFKFFGSHERRALKEIDPHRDLDSLETCSFNDFQVLEIDTIEFLVIEHYSGKRTIISTQNGGFWYNILTYEELGAAIIDKSYLKVNGYEKNIILQHEISKNGIKL